MALQITLGKWFDWLDTKLWPERHFERLYATTPDPWSCSTSTYERLKVERTCDAVLRLGPPSKVLEIGCGEGILTEMLGSAGHAVTAYEISRSAAERARARCSRFDRVDVLQGDIREQPLSRAFDLVILSEVLYYLGHGRSRAQLCRKLVQRVASGGHLLAVDPWPSARSVERALRSHAELELAEEKVFPDDSRPYATSVFRRVRGAPFIDPP